jgi:hypothetical protein
MNQYKFIHNKLEAFKINIGVHNQTANIDSSTIPIYFEKVFMYTNPNYRGNLSMKCKFLMKEFKRLVGTDDFTSRCPSSAALFTFLDQHHRHVMTSVTVVDNFFGIIGRHGATIKRNEE